MAPNWIASELRPPFFRFWKIIILLQESTLLYKIIDVCDFTEMRIYNTDKYFYYIRQKVKR